MPNQYIRMTVDVCVFEDTKGARLMKKIVGAEGPAPLGIGERSARDVMDAIKSGDIEIDDIRDIEDHSR